MILLLQVKLISPPKLKSWFFWKWRWDGMGRTQSQQLIVKSKTFDQMTPTNEKGWKYAKDCVTNHIKSKIQKSEIWEKELSFDGTAFVFVYADNELDQTTMTIKIFRTSDMWLCDTKQLHHDCNHRCTQLKIRGVVVGRGSSKSLGEGGQSFLAKTSKGGRILGFIAFLFYF